MQARAPTVMNERQWGKRGALPLHEMEGIKRPKDTDNWCWEEKKLQGTSILVFFSDFDIKCVVNIFLRGVYHLIK